MWGETVEWCCKGDTDKTNLERCIQEDLVRRWDLSQAIRDRQEKWVKEGNPGSRNKKKQNSSMGWPEDSAGG